MDQARDRLIRPAVEGDPADTFAGIAPSSAPTFVAFQLVGAGLAVVLVRALYPDAAVGAEVVVPPRDRSPAAQAHRPAS